MIFFSDLDGTLLTHEKTVSRATWHALDALAGAGIEFVPCTGRAFSGVLPELLEHPAVRHVVCSNGAAVHDVRQGARIHEVGLGLERARAVLDLCASRDVAVNAFVNDDCFCTRADWERFDEFIDDPYIIEQMVSTRSPVDEPIRSFIERAGRVERITLLWKDPTDRDELWGQLEAIDHVSVVRSYPMNIEITDADATKGSALRWLCAHLGCDLADACAFGDNMNDATMLEAAGTGVAVANAEPEALAAADAVCASNDEDGVAAYIMGWLAEHA